MLKNLKNYLKNNLPNFFLILKKTKQLYIILLSYEYLKKPIIFLKKAIKNLFFYFFKPILVIIYEKIIDKRSKYFNDYFYKKNHNFTKIPKVKKKEISCLLSIVIPSYCRSLQTKKYLIYALTQLQIALNKAKVENFEIILFDNKSIIEIASLEKEFSNMNIKYVKSNSENLLPPYLSWNEAVNYSSGKYVYLHSDDDFIYEDFFIEIYEQMKKNDEIELFYWRAKGMTNEFYDVTEFCWYWNWPKKESGYFIPARGFLRHPMPSSGWILKREFFEKHGVIGAPDEGVDYNLGVRMTKYIKKAYFCYNSISAYRHHDMQGNKLDEPTDEEAIKWRLGTAKIFYNFFDKEEAKVHGFEYIKYYAWLHGFKEIFDKLIKFNNYENCSKAGSYLFGRFWNKYFFIFYKYFLANISKEEFMIKDIKVGQPKYKIKY